jgi:hypothetical protein
MEKSQSITICGERISRANHICAFFDSKDDQYESLIPFFKEGLENNEEVITIIEDDKRADHCCKLKDAGIAYEETLQRGQLMVLSSEETYNLGGVFAAERMLTLLQDMLSKSRQGRYQFVRACGSMDWAVRNLPGTDELMQYEARVNSLIPKYKCTLICVYDINRISAAAFADILATHQMVILNGRIQTNPYFIEPVKFLKSLLSREKRPLVNT